MHTFGENSGSGVPAFLAKLWRLVEDEDTNNLIYWNAVSVKSVKSAECKKIKIKNRDTNDIYPHEIKTQNKYLHEK